MLQGNLNLTLLRDSSPDEIAAHAREMIDAVRGWSHVYSTADAVLPERHLRILLLSSGPSGSTSAHNTAGSYVPRSRRDLCLAAFEHSGRSMTRSRRSPSSFFPSSSFLLPSFLFSFLMWKTR